MQVREILKVKGSALHTVAPDASAIDAVKTMADLNMGSLVVFDKGRMAGMLSFHEILQAMRERNGVLGDVLVRDVMERDPVVTNPLMDVNDLRRAMIKTGARYLPVLDGDKVVGVISFRDVANAVLDAQDLENRMLKGLIKELPV